jgi:hypothetical protein
MLRVESFKISVFVFTAPELTVRPSNFIYVKGGLFPEVSGQSAKLVGHLRYISKLKMKLRPTQSSRRSQCHVLIMDRDQFIFTAVMKCKAVVWAVVNTVMNLRVP